MRSTLGNFGHINYGTTIKGRVHYPLENKDGCLPFNAAHFNGEHLKEGKAQKHLPIIMVDRGQCHFVVKAVNVQKFGGVLALVVDNKELEDPGYIVMSDDGTGEDISIPTFMIAKYDGYKLKEAIHKDADGGIQREGKSHSKSNKVIIQAEIDITSKSNKIDNVDLWYTGAYELV